MKACGIGGVFYPPVTAACASERRCLKCFRGRLDAVKNINVTCKPLSQLLRTIRQVLYIENRCRKSFWHTRRWFTSSLQLFFLQLNYCYAMGYCSACVPPPPSANCALTGPLWSSPRFPNPFRWMLQCHPSKTIPVSSNSPWKFVNAGMEHMLGPDWIELFEFVGVSASKPLFYTGKRPFRLVREGFLFFVLTR